MSCIVTAAEMQAVKADIMEYLSQTLIEGLVKDFDEILGSVESKKDID